MDLSSLGPGSIREQVDLACLALALCPVSEPHTTYSSNHFKPQLLFRVSKAYP